MRRSELDLTSLRSVSEPVPLHRHIAEKASSKKAGVDEEHEQAAEVESEAGGDVPGAEPSPCSARLMH